MSKINTKTIARIATIQALYQYQLTGLKQTAEELTSSISKYYKEGEFYDEADEKENSDLKIKLNNNYFTQLVIKAVENLEYIDEVISSHLADDWKWENLHISLIALLRAAICELRFFPEVPYKVVINEFTDIASDMLTENEVAFVNSLLDNTRDKLRPSSLQSN